jgi:hypothetical protein
MLASLSNETSFIDGTRPSNARSAFSHCLAKSLDFSILAIFIAW